MQQSTVTHEPTGVNPVEVTNEFDERSPDKVLTGRPIAFRASGPGVRCVGDCADRTIVCGLWEHDSGGIVQAICSNAITERTRAHARLCTSPCWMRVCE